MNRFVVSTDPVLAGTVLPDKLTVKMCLEEGQMLSTACRVMGIDNPNLYKIAHKNHPCSIWCRTTQDNFIWAYTHAMAICEEYTRRYGKVHKSQAVIEIASNYWDKMPPGPLTNFPQCMPQELTHATDPTIAYKKYMTTKPYWQDRPFRKGRDFSNFYS